MRSGIAFALRTFISVGSGLLVLTVILACGGGSDAVSTAEAAVPGRGCVERAQGGSLTPDRTTDAVVGNLAFKYTKLRSTGERTGLDSDIKSLKRRGKLGVNRWVPIKTLVVAGAANKVTVTVPAT